MAAAFSCIAMAPGGATQDELEADKTWFQIEVLVLTSTNPNALTGEEWPLQPTLTTPADWRLQPSDDVSQELQSVYQVETSQTPQGTFEVNWSNPLDKPWPGLDETLFQYQPSDLYTAALMTETDRLDYKLGSTSFPSERLFVIPRDNPNRLDAMVSGLKPIDEDTPLTSTQFWLKASSPIPKPELAEAKQRLDRSEDYQVRHYLRWAEQLGDESEALPVRLDSAASGQAWPELQGDITVYVSRYLHIKTNLWLNTDGHHLPEWQMLPPPKPIDPVQHIDLDVLRERLPHQGSELQEVTPLGRPDWLLEAGIGLQFRYLERSRPDSSLSKSLIDEESPYPYRHAVGLQQTRRMRSGEIHYIDHPAIAVIASVTRIEGETLADFKRSVLAEQATQTPN